MTAIHAFIALLLVMLFAVFGVICLGLDFASGRATPRTMLAFVCFSVVLFASLFIW